MLPNLIIIGAGKSGTTSLQRYLSVHPEVFMSTPKELNFFGGRNSERDLAWYASHFTEPARVRGEASVAYSRHPIVSGVPERMARTLPADELRIIYCVRDPFERLVSEYEHRRARSFDLWDVTTGATRNPPLRTSLDECVADGARSAFVAPSLYATQLARYDACFAAEQILVVDQHELRRDRAAQMARVLSFLGIDATFTSREWAMEHNRRFGFGRQTAAGRAAFTRIERTIGHARAAQMHGIALNAAERALGRTPARVELSVRRRRALEHLFRAETDRLRERTGLPLASWSV